MKFVCYTCRDCGMKINHEPHMCFSIPLHVAMLSKFYKCFSSNRKFSLYRDMINWLKNLDFPNHFILCSLNLDFEKVLSWSLRDLQNGVTVLCPPLLNICHHTPTSLSGNTTVNIMQELSWSHNSEDSAAAFVLSQQWRSCSSFHRLMACLFEGKAKLFIS